MKFENYKKLVLMATVASMIGTSPMMAMAAATESGADATSAGDTIEGTGNLEDYISKDIFKVVLPTVSNVNFTLDPQGLLKLKDGSKYTTDAGAVYFANDPSASGNPTYSNTSDPIEIINKSSFDIAVDFSVDVTLPEGITLVERSALANATTPSVYLAMKEGSGSAVTLVAGENKQSAAKVVTKVGEVDGSTVTKGYKLTYNNSTSKYEYALTSDFQNSDAQKASYTLIGACDSTADWSAIDEASKTITAKVVWSAERNYTGTAATFTASNSVAGMIEYTKGSGDLELANVVSVVMELDGVDYDGFNAVEGSWDNATVDSTSIKLDSEFIKYYNASSTTKAIITYKTVKGQTKTAEVMVKTK